MCHFCLLYFGNGFEHPTIQDKELVLFLCKGGNSDSIALPKLVVETVNEVTDGDQIVVGVQGSNATMLGSKINRLIIKGFFFVEITGKGALKKINELILAPIYKSFS